jgi:hypothetical protein
MTPETENVRRSSFTVLSNFKKMLEWVRDYLKSWAFFDILELLGRLSIVVAVTFWFLERPERILEKHYRAWNVINSASGHEGDGGRKDALQELNEDKVDMTAAPLSKAYLSGVVLDGASLQQADFTDANLFRASFINAQMRNTKLGGANLTNAVLTKTHLQYAVLSDANMFNSHLEGADLTNARLLNTKLPKAHSTALFCPTQNYQTLYYLEQSCLAEICLVRAFFGQR